jgi:hypothetical protein
MLKKNLWVLLGLALALAFVNPPKAHAGVVVGVTVGGPVCVRPVAPYGYYYARPLPYPSPYVYPRAYVYPGPVVYGGFYRGGYWPHERFEHREFERHEYFEHHGDYDRGRR